MTYETIDSPEFDEVRQHHDALMELGRLELMAEEIRTQAPAENQAALLHAVEVNMRKLDHELDSFKA